MKKKPRHALWIIYTSMLGAHATLIARANRKMVDTYIVGLRPILKKRNGMFFLDPMHGNQNQLRHKTIQTTYIQFKNTSESNIGLNVASLQRYTEQLLNAFFSVKLTNFSFIYSSICGSSFGTLTVQHHH